MPFSAQNGKDYIRNIVARVRHDRMLDIGCGSGTYARLFPELEWTGVEVWEPYVDRFSLDRLYERFILSDARVWKPDGRYDIGVAGDVLEHMSADDAVGVFEAMKSCCDHVIVSIPIVNYPQDEIDGNPFEAHVVEDWSVERVISVFGEPFWLGVEEPVGVFVWKR